MDKYWIVGIRAIRPSVPNFDKKARRKSARVLLSARSKQQAGAIALLHIREVRSSWIGFEVKSVEKVKLPIVLS